MGSNETEPPNPAKPSPGHGASDPSTSEATEPIETTPTAYDSLFDPKAHPVVTRNIDVADLARSLRAVVGLPPDRAGLGELAAGYLGSLPRVASGVDVHGWLGWAFAGLPLFVAGLPTLGEARDTAKAVVMVVALARTGGNVSGTAAALGTSRKVLRDNMKRLRLYPWSSTRAPGVPPHGGRKHTTDDAP